MAFDPLKGALGCETPDTVPDKGVARVGGVSSKDVALGNLADESLAVGEDRAREVEMRDDLEAPCYVEEFHEGGVKSLRGEKKCDDGAACPLPIGCHQNKAAPPRNDYPP